MSSSFDIVQHTREEWNDLGFYYDYRSETKEWVIEGSRDGLLGFALILEEYANKKKNEKLGEHDHLGPYMHLTIVTAEIPKISDYGIFGSLPDLSRLSGILNKLIKISEVGDILEIDTDYSNINEAVLRLTIKNDGFDPSEPDEMAWSKK